MTAPPRPKRWRRVFWRIAFVLPALLAAGYLLFTGPRHPDRYPLREGSPCRLPWPAGQTKLCSQSNRAVVSHGGVPRMLLFSTSGNTSAR